MIEKDTEQIKCATFCIDSYNRFDLFLTLALAGIFHNTSWQGGGGWMRPPPPTFRN